MNQHVIAYYQHNKYYDDVYLELGRACKCDKLIEILLFG